MAAFSHQVFMPVADVSGLAEADLRNLLVRLRSDILWRRQETGMFSSFLIRLHEIRHSVDLKIHAVALHKKGQQHNLVEMVRQLVVLHSHSKQHAHHHRKGKALLTDTQKTAIVEQQLTYLQRHFKNIKQEISDTHDSFEAKVRDVSMFRRYLTEQQAYFQRTIVDAGARFGTISSEKLMLWFQHTLVALGSMIESVRLHRTKNLNDTKIINYIMSQPTESMTKVYFFALEIQCGQAVEELQVQKSKFGLLKKQFNKITHKHGQMTNKLAELNTVLLDTEQKIEECHCSQEVVQETTKASDIETVKLTRSNAVLAKKVHSFVFPTVENYVKLEKEIENCQHELRTWRAKIENAQNLQLLRPRTAGFTAKTSACKKRSLPLVNQSCAL